MAEASNGGWVKSAANGWASVRRCAASTAANSTAVGSTLSRMRSRASSTESGGDIASLRSSAGPCCAWGRRPRCAPAPVLGPALARTALELLCARVSPLPLMVRRPIGARPAAGLLQQADAFEHHGFVGGLEHVVEGEAGDRDRGKGLHLDTRLARHLHLGRHLD